MCAVPVRLVKSDHATRPHVLGEPAEHQRRVRLEQQDVSPDHGIEAPVEDHLRRIALAKAYVAYSAGPRPFRRRSDRGCRSVGADHGSDFANQIGDEERGITRPTANIERVHADRDPGLTEELSRHRRDQAILCAESLQLAT